MENEEKPVTDTADTKPVGAPVSVEAATEQVQSFFGPMQQLLEAIRVPDRILFEDIYGNQYSVRPVMSTDRWLDVMIMMGRVGEHVTKEFEHIKATVATNTTAVEDPETGEVIDAQWSVMQGVIWAITRACGDGELRAALNDLFVTVHPKVMKKAADAAREEGDPYASGTALFEPHEMARGLLPFFARAATKTGQVVAEYMPKKEENPAIPSAQSAPSSAPSSVEAMT